MRRCTFAKSKDPKEDQRTSGVDRDRKGSHRSDFGYVLIEEVNSTEDLEKRGKQGVERMFDDESQERRGTDLHEIDDIFASLPDP